MLARISRTVPGAARPFANRETRQRSEGASAARKNPYAARRDIGRRKLPKYSEYCVFASESTISPGKIASYFSGLDRKFVTPRINGIFHRINELKP
jgi:hypothetical protein